MYLKSGHAFLIQFSYMNAKENGDREQEKTNDEMVWAAYFI